MSEKIAFTVLLDSKTSQQVRMVIPNHLVTFPEDSDGYEYMFVPVENESGDFEFLCTEDINMMTPSIPDDLESMVVFKTARGDRWPVHTQKAVLQMSEQMGKLTVLDGNKD